MKILAIETSCDETAAAIVESGRKICSSIILSQINKHQEWGGVIPEFASRMHLNDIHDVISFCLTEANLTLNNIDALAVTHGPGLLGSLLVGINTAKTLAWIYNKPLIPVNHLMGHIAANFLETNLKPPFICLLASGGHTQIILVNDYTQMTIIGETIDDAAGECFDKTARLLDIPYPGGPELDKVAQQFKGKKNQFQFPTPSIKGYDFSFSGIKTSALRLLQKLSHEYGKDYIYRKDIKSEIAAAFQNNIAKILKNKLSKALEEFDINQIVIAGGVAANSSLRQELNQAFIDSHITVYYPPIKYCTDNAAMIAAAAYFKYQQSTEQNIYNEYRFEAFSRMSDKNIV